MRSQMKTVLRRVESGFRGTPRTLYSAGGNDKTADSSADEKTPLVNRYRVVLNCQAAAGDVERCRRITVGPTSK